jgi:hypothetical protein
METKKSQNLSLNIFIKKYANNFWRIFVAFKANMSKNVFFDFFIKLLYAGFDFWTFINVHF